MYAASKFAGSRAGLRGPPYERAYVSADTAAISALM
jgi:hypothetical protein